MVSWLFIKCRLRHGRLCPPIVDTWTVVSRNQSFLLTLEETTYFLMWEGPLHLPHFKSSTLSRNYFFSADYEGVTFFTTNNPTSFSFSTNRSTNHLLFVLMEISQMKQTIHCFMQFSIVNEWMLNIEEGKTADENGDRTFLMLGWRLIRYIDNLYGDSSTPPLLVKICLL